MSPTTIRIVRTLVLAMVSLTFPAGRAPASERSAILTSEALIELHAGKLQEARLLLDRAVHDDPRDPDALYYRGVTAARLDDLATAITDLEAVLTLRPQRYEAMLELGIAYFEDGSYDMALRRLARVEHHPRLGPVASFFSGLVYLRMEHPANALPRFEVAAEDAKYRVPARYYVGLALYQLGNTAEAQRHFAFVAESASRTAMASEAQRFLDTMAGVREETLDLYAAVGFEYDSNVPLAPSDQAVQDSLLITDESDARFRLNAGTRYPISLARNLTLSVGYDFSQNLYLELDEFNLQNHRAQTGLLWRSAIGDLGLLSRYDFFLLDKDAFVQQGTVMPWLRLPTNEFGDLEISYRWRIQDYFQERFAARVDANNHHFGLRQSVYLDSASRRLWLGYSFERNDGRHSQGDAFSYGANEASAGFDWAVDAIELSAQLAYWFRRLDYSGASGGRRDDQHGLLFVVRQPIADWLALTLSYLGTFNDSKQALYDYDRHVASLAVEVALR